MAHSIAFNWSALFQLTSVQLSVIDNRVGNSTAHSTLLLPIYSWKGEQRNRNWLSRDFKWSIFCCWSWQGYDWTMQSWLNADTNISYHYVVRKWVLLVYVEIYFYVKNNTCMHECKEIWNVFTKISCSTNMGNKCVIFHAGILLSSLLKK